MALSTFALKVNGQPVIVETSPGTTLLSVLRNELEMTGSKEGCGKGECGACTVLIDGEPACSCLIMVSQADGCDVLTVEGLERDGVLDPVQQSFLEEGGIQCGFCTPGMVLTAKFILSARRRLSEEQIMAAISGNLCRCTGYSKIVKAIARASEKVEAIV